MRIYDPTAFFMRLLAETFKDIMDFFIMFLVIITAFANVVLILNAGKKDHDEEPLFESNMESDIISSWINEYKVSLGTFDTHSFDGEKE